MGLRLFASAGLLVAAAPAIVWAQGGSTDASRNWEAVAACAAIDATERRHQCMDDVLRRAGLLSAERVAEAARQEFGRDGRAEAPRVTERAQAAAAAPVPAQAQAQAQASPAPAAVAAAPTRPADIDEVATTVASVRTVGYRRLVVTTAEGSVWQQTESEDFTTTPKVGDAFVIQRAAFNSYRCRFGNSSRYRCQRLD